MNRWKAARQDVRNSSADGGNGTTDDGDGEETVER